MKTKSTWASEFALKRRAIDRAILAEAEKYFTDLEAREATQTLPESPIDFSGVHDRTEAQEARAAIARAFGRPIR